MKERIHNLKKHRSLRQKLRNDPTKSEQVLWKYIRSSQLGYKFRRQQSIGNFIVDFYCPKLKIIIEVDGWIHGEEIKKIKDEERQNFLEQQGFLVLRYRNEQLKYDLNAVLQDIYNHCLKRSKINHP